MTIQQSNVLTEEQKHEIQELERVCFARDGLENHAFLSNEINYDRSIPVFFLAYEGGALIGFLTFFIPTGEEAEISGMVHPAYQRKDVFTRLDEAARKVIGQNGIGRTLYCVEPKSESAGQVLKRWDICEIQRSEYRMEADAGHGRRGESASAQDGLFSVKRVSPETLADYQRITAEAFGEENPQYADTLMTSGDRMGYVLYREGAPVGVFVLGLEDEGAPVLYGVAVAKAERGKGYGRALMERACALGAERGSTLRLDVDSENPVAFRLYQSMGFSVTFQVDYYVRRGRKRNGVGSTLS